MTLKNKLIAVLGAVITFVAIALTASAAESHTFSHESGTYNNTQLVRINADENINVYYTTDGSLPTSDSALYISKPIVVSKNTKIRTAAYEDGMLIGYDSITVKIHTAAPKASVISGTYSEPFSVELTCVDKGAKIYYTTDGSVPTKNAILYTEPIKITEDTQLKYVALRSGRNYSKYYIRNYKLSTDVYAEPQRQDMLELVNELRKSYGLCELETIPELSDIAQQRAEECASYYSHWRADGTKWDYLLGNAGLKRNVRAENLAYYYPTAKQALNAWLDDYYHKANLLNPDARYIGIGYYSNGYSNYWSQLFIGEE